MKTSRSYSQAPQYRVSVLMLAAGEGSRLGSHPKALLKKDGKTLLESFVTSIQHLSPIEFLVITGYHADVIEAEFQRLNMGRLSTMRVCRNLAPENGLASSVRLGLEALNGEFDILLIALSDQPEIGVGEIRELLDAYSQRQQGEEIILPVFNGKRGNPVLFSRKVIEEILAIPEMNCRSYMDLYPAKIRLMQTDNRAFVLDIDTPRDVDSNKLTF
jgi:molybdenum cofactor cytidylyltransferase